MMRFANDMLSSADEKCGFLGFKPPLTTDLKFDILRLKLTALFWLKYVTRGFCSISPCFYCAIQWDWIMVFHSESRFCLQVEIKQKSWYVSHRLSLKSKKYWSNLYLLSPLNLVSLFTSSEISLSGDSIF